MTTPQNPLSALNDPTLLRTDSLIAGEWVRSAAPRFAVHDPATGGRIADCANMGAAEAGAAIAAADRAWPAGGRARPASAAPS